MNVLRHLMPSLAALVLTVACDRTPVPTAPSGHPSLAGATASATGRIAFVSNRDGNNEIYLMNGDGSGVTRLTNDPASDTYPAWSPDGSRIVFTSNRSGSDEIYVMNADGTGVTRLTTTPNSGWSGQPAWCGHRIAYTSDQYLPPFTDVYVMNDDGTGVTRLTIGNASDEAYPSWSPDCSQIAYSSEPTSSDAAIYWMTADGTTEGGVATGGGHTKYPAWSPDGTKVAFSSDRDDFGNSYEIYTVGMIDRQLIRVTVRSNFHMYFMPAWSPDGSKIVFQANATSSDGMYVVNADGSGGEARLADSTWFNNRAAWSGVAAPPPNEPPVAAFSASCTDLTCSFTSTSSDPDGLVSAYSWTFGDGGTSTVQNPSRAYGAAGTYTVTLTVTDNQGATNSVAHSVTVSPGTPPPVSTITLDQTTGVLPDAEAWPAGGTHIGKDFPTNPHLGDAIVATFFWRGTTNTITTVTDHFCDANSTPIGNTYTLVDYVTAGGYSMATYVATNVQGFPDPATTDDQHLCVHALFSDTITEGGMILSAYSGVDAVTASALGAHHSAIGSDSTTTVADPGAIAIGTGALAYAVTMADGAVGTDPPAGFANVEEVEDDFLKADGEYEVVAAEGTVEPTWNWYFTSSHAWLATVLALNPASGGSTR